MGQGPVQLGQEYCVCDPETYEGCTPAEVQAAIVASPEYAAAHQATADANKIFGLPRTTFYLIAASAAALLVLKR